MVMGRPPAVEIVAWRPPLTADAWLKLTAPKLPSGSTPPRRAVGASSIHSADDKDDAYWPMSWYRSPVVLHEDSRKFAAEFVGTFVLVLGGVGSAVLAGDKIGWTWCRVRLRAVAAGNGVRGAAAATRRY
jgi:hypothetical protein